jgi:hypothetical protein
MLPRVGSSDPPLGLRDKEFNYIPGNKSGDWTMLGLHGRGTMARAIGTTQCEAPEGALRY